MRKTLISPLGFHMHMYVHHMHWQDPSVRLPHEVPPHLLFLNIKLLLAYSMFLVIQFLIFMAFIAYTWKDTQVNVKKVRSVSYITSTIQMEC